MGEIEEAYGLFGSGPGLLDERRQLLLRKHAIDVNSIVGTA